ncbi:MAG: hypothetical protein VZR36_00275 [Prevotella sp.]|nr:hypothetical protein [Prevotella sp.]
MIYEETVAGGTSPELLLQKNSNGSLTAVIPLENIEGDLTLTFRTNNQKIKVESTTSGITGGVEEKKSGVHTTTFSGVTTEMTSITIKFTCSGSSNVRLDDIVLKGTKSASAPTGIAINETNFPDDVFRAWVAENCDKAPEGGEKDGYLDDEEIAAQVIIGINNKNIEDLKGIEYFTAATMLMCDGNKLQTLDVSKNTKLTQLICYGNKLTSLNVSKNTALTSLHCTDNQLTSLNVSNNTELGMLLCQNNQLTSLDVTNNQKLTTLDCSNNLINETEMGKLVASMPTISGNPGIFYPFNQSVEDANVITTTQVNDAKAKNWNVQAWNGSAYEDYAGVEPTPETNEYYEKVTTAPSDWSGEYLIVYEEGSVAFDSSLQTLDAPHNTIDVVIEEGNKIKATNDVKSSAFTIEETTGGYSIKSTSGNYIGVISNSNGLKQNTDKAYPHNLSISEGGDAVIAAVFDGSTMTLRFNSATNDSRFRYYKTGQKAIQLYKKTVALDNQYTLVTVEDEGETETAFDGNSLTKELPAQTKFYIKDNNGNKYYGTADDYGVATILAENHENMSTSATGANFYLRKANTWVFTVAELETAEGITVTVNPQTVGETKYMISHSLTEESEDVFDENLQLTKEMDTEAFYIIRSDDYGIFEMTAADHNVSDETSFYYIWEFSEDAPTVGYIPARRTNMYRVSKPGTYTFTLDTENKTVTAQFVSSKQYTLVKVEGFGETATETEYPFEGLTLTKEFTDPSRFYIKDSDGNNYYGLQNTEYEVDRYIIRTENHENLQTVESGEEFLLKKGNTWVFTITELDAATTAGGITLTVNPETVGETKYMISYSLTEESEDVFDENLKLTKEMDTTPFYITRSDDYGIFEVTAVERTNPDGYYRFTFTEDNNTVGFKVGERRNMYEMSEAGVYDFSLDLDAKTVTAVKTTEVTAAGNLNNSATGVFYGVDDMSGNGNDNKGKSATGKLTTAFGDVEVVYTVGTEYGNAYLKNDHIRMYAEGTTLKFTAPEGYVLTKIVLEKSSGNFNNLTTDVETYTNGTWEGEEESVTFTSQNATIQLLAAEVTLKKANFVKVSISAAEWATFVTPIAVAFPEDVNAYIIKETYADRAVGEKITEAPAGTAVIINGTEGTHKLPDIGKSAEIESNKLLVSDGTVTGDGTIYVLAVQGGQAGFAPLKSGKTLSEGKAYLKMENAGAKIAFAIDGEATDIRSIENTVDFSNGDWYNLQGVKVTSPQKGIYIHNGKKVVIK